MSKPVTKDNFELKTELKSNGIGVKKRSVNITRLFTEVNGKQLKHAEIDGIRYGIINQFTNGIATGTTYEIGLRSKTGEELKILMFKNPRNKDEGMALYNKLLDSLWYACTSSMVTDYHNALLEGKEVKVGRFTLTQNGVKIKVWKLFGGKEHFVEWKDVGKNISNGRLVLSSISNKKIHASEGLKDSWNAVVILSLLDWLWEEGRVYKLKDGPRQTTWG